MHAQVFLISLLSSIGLSAGELQPVDFFNDLLPPVPAENNNPWPPAWEAAFRKRFREFIDREEHPAPSTVWASEKSGGGFLAFIKGRREEALASMRIQPSDVGHTAGIDFYWCFHLEKQPRYFFQYGKYQPPEFMAKMKEGARLWTAEDPRPNLELILQLDGPDAEVVAHAKKQITAMWRSADQVKEMAAQARAECKDGQPANKILFANYLEKILPAYPAAMPQNTAGWMAWWKLISDGDWLIYEEYERRTNPRPHPKYGIGQGPVGSSWDPGVRGGWVDWRNTDNLRSMREVSVYLFAEATGNELVRKVYRERIRRTARGFLGIGNGEWDSPAYLGLTINGYLMLYDFARDREVRLLAKGLLDYLATTAAIKYFHGGASGPNTRDYGTWQSGQGGSASRAWSTWLLDPQSPVTSYAEFLFLSAYRPPPAVAALAARQHALPCEILASHPVFNNWVPGGSDAPAYHEVQYRSREFQMGSTIEGGSGSGGHGNNGAKAVLRHPKRGFDYLMATSRTNENPCIAGNDRIAQCRNAWLWVGAGQPDKTGAVKAPSWRLMIPTDSVAERVGEVVLLRFASSWAAVHPVGCTLGDPDAKLILDHMGKPKSSKGAPPPPPPSTEGQPLMLPATAAAGRTVTGLAIELADSLHFPDYETFKQAVLTKAKVAEVNGKISFTAASGAQVAMTWDGKSALPTVERDGKPHDWKQHRALWQAGSTGPSPVNLGWKEGKLKVEAGGHRFEGTLDMVSGNYSFRNTGPGSE